jgi:hypothetical protein
MADIYGCDDFYNNENLVDVVDEKGSDALTIIFILCFALATFICSCVDEFNQNNR